MKKYYKLVFMVILAMVVICSMASAQQPKSAPPTKQLPGVIQWQFAIHMAPGAPIYRVFEIFVQDVDKYTDGRLKIKLVNTFALGYQGAEIGDIVGKGLLPMSVMMMGWDVGRHPETSILELPFMYPEALQDYTANLLRPYYEKLLDKRNLIIPMWWGAAERLWTKKPVKGLNDLKRLKIRCASPWSAKGLAPLGASAVSMPRGEMYTALQTGVIDGTFSDPGSAHESKIYEVCKYGSKLYVSNNRMTCLLNKDAFYALPKDIQELLRRAWRENEPRLQTEYNAVLHPELWTAMEKDGPCTISNFPKEDWAKVRQGTRFIWDDWRKAVDTEGNRALDKVLEFLESVPLPDQW